MMELRVVIILLSSLLRGVTAWTTADRDTCRFNCGNQLYSCSCSHSCMYYGNCCNDYYDYCSIATTYSSLNTTADVTESCYGKYTASSGQITSPNYPNNYPNNVNCSWLISSGGGMNIRLTFTFVHIEESTGCIFDGIHVYDGPTNSSALIGTLCGSTKRTFYSSGSDLTIHFYSDSIVSGEGFVARYIFEYPWATTEDPWATTADNFSCRGKCGSGTGKCFCDSSCQRMGNCCHDFLDYCSNLILSTTPEPISCRWNCGYNFSSCSCQSSCQYYGNCCHDYHNYCYYTTTPEPISCRWNCGYNFSSCSCHSSCQYYGNCCHDYHGYCQSEYPTPAVTAPSCGGPLFGSGSLSSPYYPFYYHDNAYCIWQLSATAGERIFLSFLDLELENCCNCDYVNVYDGSTITSPLLGKLCYNGTLQDFHSSSSYLTVLFKSDSSVVARGFKASFSSSLPSSTARVACSSDSMAIVIRRSYLDSLGIGWQNLYLDDHRCRPSANSYEVSFNFPVDMCGTNKTFNNRRIVYSNHVRAAPSQSGEITRLIDQFLLLVSCHMEQDTTVGQVYKAEETINNTIIGNGHFNATMAFYTSSSFSYPILDFPYEVRLNQELFVQVQLTKPDNTLDLFLDTCMASPNHDFQARTYTLFQNGCQQDSTVYIYTNGQHHNAQFKFNAFKFLRTHSYVFLRCKVLVCADNDYGSRCRQGCRMRKKRSLDSSHHTAVVTLGPITLRGARPSAAKVDIGK